MGHLFKYKWVWFLAITLLIIIGACALLFGYAMAIGWEAVGKWFTSKWAFIVYAVAGFYFFFWANILVRDSI